MAGIFETVQTDAGFHGRINALNGEPLFSGEVHPDERDADNAFLVLFGLVLAMAQQSGMAVIEHVDEREGTQT